jgi:hypothetical protein
MSEEKKVGSWYKIFHPSVVFLNLEMIWNWVKEKKVGFGTRSSIGSIEEKRKDTSPNKRSNLKVQKHTMGKP